MIKNLTLKILNFCFYVSMSLCLVPHLRSLDDRLSYPVMLSPYPCFISLLYLDLYVLGDDALIS